MSTEIRRVIGAALIPAVLLAVLVFLSETFSGAISGYAAACANFLTYWPLDLVRLVRPAPTDEGFYNSWVGLSLAVSLVLQALLVYFCAVRMASRQGT
jgi:hypothetical protein